MSDKPKVRFKWLEKIKNVKHIEIYIVIIFLVIVFLIYGSTFKDKRKTTAQSTEELPLTISKYVDDLEKNLESTLSNIKGASNVNVLITLDLKDAEIKDNVIHTSNFPSIKGVLIVASGVENTNVKLNMLKAVQAVIEINTGCIEILSSN